MKHTKLAVAASDHHADMLYATGFRAPDPFVFVEKQGRRILLMSDLEIDRARQTARVDDVVSFSDFEKKVQGKRKRKPLYARVLAGFLCDQKAKKAMVSSDFPMGLAKALKKEGIRLRPVKGPFFPEREIKTSKEIQALTRATKIAESGMARAFEVLAASKIRKDRKLVWSKKLLTSEILRVEIESAILRAGGEARMDSIVAGGEQACDPHARGTGPLKANELIILDIFPRDAKTGYFGDITRTVIRGTASQAQRQLWDLCLQGQQQALQALKPGINGLALQNDIREFFANAGYPTEIHEGRWRGFFHGLGHGLGLEIHELPRVATPNLQKGIVITVEPGIYWPGIGGVRHEDVIVLTTKGNRLLTSHPKPLEI
ncbi:MAG: Xaa-Pro peptidase family protein [Terrimicrobiaceae bacterium]